MEVNLQKERKRERRTCVICTAMFPCMVSLTYCEDVAKEAKEKKEGISKEHPVVDLRILQSSSREKRLRRRDEGGGGGGGGKGKLPQRSSFSIAMIDLQCYSP